MKKLVFLSLVMAFASASVLTAHADSMLGKAAKLSVVKRADNDSIVKKSVKLKAASRVVRNDNDSTIKKAVKLNMIK
jgi:hypothetical protein